MLPKHKTEAAKGVWSQFLSEFTDAKETKTSGIFAVEENVPITLAYLV